MLTAVKGYNFETTTYNKEFMIKENRDFRITNIHLYSMYNKTKKKLTIYVHDEYDHIIHKHETQWSKNDLKVNIFDSITFTKYNKIVLQVQQHLTQDSTLDELTLEVTIEFMQSLEYLIYDPDNNSLRVRITS